MFTRVKSRCAHHLRPPKDWLDALLGRMIGCVAAGIRAVVSLPHR